MDYILHKENLIKLYKESFNDTAEYVEYFFSKIYDADNCVYHYIDGECVSALHLIPKKLNFFETVLSCPYIFAAATSVKHRGNGYMGLVMSKAFNKLYDEGQYLAALYPFKHSFYEKFGFRTICYCKPYNINYEGKNVKCSLYKNSPESLLKIYNGFFKDYDVYIERDKSFMQLKINECLVDGGKIYLVKDGYIMSGNNEIGEAIFPDPKILSGIKEIDKFNVKLPGGTGLDEPYTMARVINAKKLLEKISYDCKNTKIGLKISDNYFNKNNITVSLDIKSNFAAVADCTAYDFSLTIEELTQLVFGCYNKNNSHIPQRLKQIFPVKKTFLYDQI